MSGSPRGPRRAISRKLPGWKRIVAEPIGVKRICTASPCEGRTSAALIYAVLIYAVLIYAVLIYAVLIYAVLICGVRRCPAPTSAVPTCDGQTSWAPISAE